jgi:hypothetical protein
MHITKRQLDDKLELFKLAGFTETGSGWDYAIPQEYFDKLTMMGIDNPGAWFLMDCSSRPWALHHVGEAYCAILAHRSKANQEQWDPLFKMRNSKDAQEKALASFIYDSPDNRVLDEADAGLLDLNYIIAAFNHGWVGASRWQEQFMLQSAWSEKREGEKPFCFVIRTKEYACSGTNYVVHMMTDDGGFHHGFYTDDSVEALHNFVERCKGKDITPLPRPLVNEN